MTALGIFSLLLLANTDQNVGNSWLMSGGPVSNSLQSSIEAKDKIALRKVWPGQILFVNRADNSRPVAEAMSAEKLFEIVDGCNVNSKYDNSPYMNEQQNKDFKGIVEWHCPDKRIVGKPCFFEQYSITIEPIKYFRAEPELYVLFDTAHDDKKCGQPRPPMRGEVVN